MRKKIPDSKVIEQTLGERKLVLASNRGPIQFERGKDGKREWRRGAGGLITALDSILKATKAYWIASAMTEEDSQVAKNQKLLGLPEDDPFYWIYLLDIPPDKYDQYYNEISNDLLWFLNHHLFDVANEPTFGSQFRKAWDNGYVAVNKQFAQTIAALTKGDDDPVIMIQDYHLYLVGGFLRQLKRDAVLFHFVHVPWCSPDYFRILPTDVRQAILESLLTLDIVGFHSRRYVRNFILCCQDLLGCRIDLRHGKVYYRDRVVLVKAYPISIGVEETRKMLEIPEVSEGIEKLSEITDKYKLILRVDRAELSKNLIRGFEAFAMLLDTHPELLGTLKFLAYAYPSREYLKKYSDYRRAIEEKVAEINSKYGNSQWQPIDLQIDDNYYRSIAALSRFDVLLTNPVFDGMNLVAKEASVLNSRDGVIVLSENAGAYEELRDGVLGINPFDLEDTAKKLYQALTMTPLERGLRATRLKEIVKRNDVLKWLRHQLRDIEKVSKT